MRQKPRLKLCLSKYIFWGTAFLAAGIIFYYFLSQAFIRNIEKPLIDYSLQSSKIVESEIKNNLKILETISSQYALKSSHITMDEKIELLASEAKRNSYKRLSIVDLHGNAKTTDKKNVYVGDRAYFKDALSGRSIISEPLESRVDDSTVLVFAVPIKDNDSITGVLYSALEMDVLCKILDNVKQGNPYSSFIINKKGTLIADESHSNLLLKENLLDTAMKDPAQRQFAKILKKMTEGKSGTGQCYYRGVKSYIAFNPIAGTDWSIAVTITKSHAFENLNSIALFIVILVAFITFLIIFHSLYTKFLESKLSIEKSNTAKVIEAANIIVIYMNSNGKIINFNQYAEQKTGISREDAIESKSIFNITPHSEHEKIKALLQPSGEFQDLLGFEFPLIDRVGQISHIVWNIEYTESSSEYSAYDIELLGLDITKRVENEKLITKMAYHDFLTDLPNRVMLYEKVRESIKTAMENGSKGAFVLIDLDNFKDINDSYGHSFGDLLIKEISRRLTAFADNCSTVFRLGGDEFIVLIENLKDKLQCEDYLNKVMDTFSLPISINSRLIHVSCSIGVSLFPDDSNDVESLLKNSDSAMYYAKKKRRRKYMFFDKSMNDEIVEKMELESKLRSAIENKEFILNYQPQIELKTGKIRGFEALIRWMNPERGLIPPLKFINIAEETGLIIPIGNWVMKTACQFAKHLQKTGFGKYNISVNVSIIQLIQDDFVDIVTNTLKETGLEPSYLEIELTESVLMESIEQCMGKLEKLRNMGIKVSLDDFGKGYSSFSYLKQLPINVLKIDKSFIDDINTNPNITESIVHFGHKLGLSVIAEGVENSQQLEYLVKSHCNIVQGYFFSKPVSEQDAIKIICTSKFINK